MRIGGSHATSGSAPSNGYRTADRRYRTLVNCTEAEGGSAHDANTCFGGASFGQISF